LNGHFSLFATTYPLNDPPLLAPLLLHHFLARLLTAVLPLAEFSVCSAPFSALLTCSVNLTYPRAHGTHIMAKSNAMIMMKLCNVQCQVVGPVQVCWSLL